MSRKPPGQTLASSVALGAVHRNAPVRVSTTKVPEPVYRAAFAALIERMKKTYWNLHAKPASLGREGLTVREAAEQTLAYLARYVRRVAISNVRLISMDDGYVTFYYKDTRDGGRQKIDRVPALEFIDRFLQHVLPRGKRHVRNFGFLSPGQRTEKLKLIRELLGMDATHDQPEKTHGADEPRKEQEEVPSDLCPCCQVGRMVLERQFPRPTVREIMGMSSDELRQPKLPFW